MELDSLALTAAGLNVAAALWERHGVPNTVISNVILLVGISAIAGTHPMLGAGLGVLYLTGTLLVRGPALASWAQQVVS